MPCPEHNGCLAHCQIRWREVKGMLKIYQLKKGDKPSLRMEYRVWKCRNQNSLGGQNKSWKGEWAKLGWVLCVLPRALYCRRVLLWISATLKFFCLFCFYCLIHTYIQQLLHFMFCWSANSAWYKVIIGSLVLFLVQTDCSHPTLSSNLGTTAALLRKASDL